MSQMHAQAYKANLYTMYIYYYLKQLHNECRPFTANQKQPTNQPTKNKIQHNDNSNLQ